MIKIVKSVIGVTLLEIMLVLAIAAMIIVMSVRYYQAATTSQQTTSVTNLLLAVATAMDSLSAAGGSYATVGDTTSARTAVETYLGGPNSLNTSLGTPLTFTAVGTSSYGVSVTLGTTVCGNVKKQIAGNSKFSGASCDSTSGALTYTYDRTK